MKSRLCFLVALLLIGSAGAGEQQGLIVRSATVYSDASSVSEQIGQLAAGTRVSIFSRKGGWNEIFSEQEAITGWVRTYQVRAGELVRSTEVKSQPDSRGFLSGLASFSRKASSFFSIGGSRTSSSTATIGVRGISEEQIQSAEPDFAELEKMKAFVSNDMRLENFQAEGQLSASEIKHIKPKKRTVKDPGRGEK